MSSAIDLPKELTEQPTANVILTGLDVKYNAIHKSIWDSFSNNRRSDRVPISFGCLPGDHVYPRCKEKRSSYEWYIPKGLLKSIWLKKNLHQVPAVVVIFYELDWDEAAWRERQMECASRVEVVRTSLQGRGTKVAVVLIQRSTPLPPGEDMVAAERAAALCSACDLSAKSLFVLPHTDHLLGYIIRLENAFYDLANSYYHTEHRRVKAHKEFLNKTTHQLLYPRHQFKIAFLHELMQDATTAVKHYKQAYTHIHELRSHNTNNLEIKVFGGFINYKICRLCFLSLNTPLDAIAQFRKHIDLFKPKVGYAELLFEHSAWMCKQFHLFGDLFSEAIGKGLAAIQTQHPGFYYQQAAYYAQERRKQSKSLCSILENYPKQDPLEGGGDDLEFYGQRPWRQGHQSIDPPDVNREKEGILALQHQESKVDHSWIVIKLLSDAITQFKKYNCPRMKRFLSVQMGEEYYLAKDYSKAATLLTYVTWDFRSHHWRDILTRILCLTLRCSYLTCDVKLYVATCMELMGNCTNVSDKDKTRIQMNLIRVISGVTPEVETLPDSHEADGGGINIALDASINHQWVQVLGQPTIYSFEMNSLISFINCKIRFTKESFLADELVHLHVYVQTLCPFPIRFSELSVSLGRPEYDKYCMLSEHTVQGRSDLFFESMKIKKISFKFAIDPDDVDKFIQVLSVEMKLSSDAEPGIGSTALLTWNGSCNNAGVKPSEQDPKVQTAMRMNEVTCWDEIIPSLKTDICRRKSKLETAIEYFPSALQSEVFPFHIKITSNEISEAKNVAVFVRLEPGQSEEIIYSTFLSLKAETILSSSTNKALEISFGNIEASSQETMSFYVYSSRVGIKKLLLTISYEIYDEVVKEKKFILCSCSEELNVQFDTLPAMEIKTELLRNDFCDLMTADPCSTFSGFVNISCLSPSPIEISSAEVVLNTKQKHISLDMAVSKSQCISDIVLKKDEIASDAISFKVNDYFTQSRVYECEVGGYKVVWRRFVDEVNEMPFVTSYKSFPNITVTPRALRAIVDLPTFGELKKPIELTYTLQNCTQKVQDVEISCDVTENFMYSGNKLKKTRILPKADLILRYGLFPLAVGFQTLPKINVKLLQSEEMLREGDYELCSYLDEYLPNDIFIKPPQPNVQSTNF